MKIIIKLLILAAVIGGGTYLAQNQGLIPKFQPGEKVEETKEQLEGSVKGITDDLSKQTQKLTTRSQEVTKHINNVLGAYIQPVDDESTSDSESANEEDSSTDNSSSSESTSDKPIYEETLDYGRYLYCKQVVEDYEN